MMLHSAPPKVWASLDADLPQRCQAGISRPPRSGLTHARVAMARKSLQSYALQPATDLPRDVAELALPEGST